MKTYAYGFPRLGKNREFKKLVESFWCKDITEKELFDGLENIQKDNIRTYSRRVNLYPDGEMTFYDAMLDTAILLGLFYIVSIGEYYNLCRGKDALEMTKWFNTNYHYLVTNFNQLKNIKCVLNYDHFALRFKQGKFPAVIGPFTFLKLSKGVNKKIFKKLFFEFVNVFSELLKKVDKVQIEEPAFVLELTKDEILMIKEGYKCFSEYKNKIILITYYDYVDWIEHLFEIPVSAIGLDFVHTVENLDYICKNGFPKDKILIAGLVDGRNVWKNDVNKTLELLTKISSKVKNVMISNAAPLFHLPISLENEVSLPVELKNKLSFAEEKLDELRFISYCFNGKKKPKPQKLSDFGINNDVIKRVRSLKNKDFIKRVNYEKRRVLHNKIFKLPLFPTTTIGSFPQTKEIRKRRLEYKKGLLSYRKYKVFIKREINKLIKFQEKIGLDVLVHGEFERTDMVEFFAEKLEGIKTTSEGWIISYGTRVYRPPIIFGDVYRLKPMTLEEICWAQSKTKKLVKGMLTGPVTIIAWSFCREDIAMSEIAYQIALCIRDEIIDYEKSGIKIVQVDEPAFREKAPIKRRCWPMYFRWSVNSFNLATNTDPSTQIHTHMCYSEFGDIIRYINKLDFDVITIEASRSRSDILKFFKNINFRKQIGLGVWDIHSLYLPSVDEIVNFVQRALNDIPKENFWLNPDCGLKTKKWPEVKQALTNMVIVAKLLRKQNNVLKG